MYSSTFSQQEEQIKERGARERVTRDLSEGQNKYPSPQCNKQVLRYAKFLKELCTSKRKLKGNEIFSVGENASAIIQRKLPPKCKDPGMFTIPCIIGDQRIERAMLDLGASINVMPYSIYASLNLGPLK